MPLKWLQEVTASSRAKLAAEVAKFKNKDFMDAAVAAIAMIAAADGMIAPAEKAKMMGIVQRSEELKAFETEKVIEAFKKYADNFEFDAGFGKAEALKAIGKLRGKDEQARHVVRVACLIGGADGNFDENEKTAVREICRDLGLNPADFDL